MTDGSSQGDAGGRNWDAAYRTEYYLRRNRRFISEPDDFRQQVALEMLEDPDATALRVCRRVVQRMWRAKKFISLDAIVEPMARPPAELPVLPASLNLVERRMCKMILLGYSKKEIALGLHCSVQDVYAVFREMQCKWLWHTESTR